MNNNDEFKPVSHSDVTGDKYEHPSFGVIEISRYQGGEQPLFGSSILHHNGITISIRTACLHRNLNSDWIHGDKLICEFHMSPTQFADAITSLNHGGGTPITLRYVKGDEKDRPQTPFKSKVKQFNEEFEQDCKNISKRLNDTINLAKETHAQKRLISEIESLRQFFTSTLPFVNESFTEQVEHTVKEAKGEVEAFVNSMVQNYGIEAIKKQSPQIIEGEVKELKGGNTDE